MDTRDLNLTARERMARLLGRKDVLMELEPLLEEAGALAERMSAQPKTASGEELLKTFAADRAAAMAVIARICGYAYSAGQELTDEMKLGRVEGGGSASG